MTANCATTYRLRGCALSVALLLLGGCVAQYSNHGYFPPPEDLEQIDLGDTRSTVEETLGPSSTGSVLDDGGIYYVRSRVRTRGMFEPEVIDRQVLAISFDRNDRVSNVELFGLEDGNVVPLSRRVTDTNIDTQTFWSQLIGNIGRIGPGG